jgi:hypothetical protein
MPSIVIHHMGFMSLIGGQDATAQPSYAPFMADYGDTFRTYKHVALHGLIAGIFIDSPIISINGLFEQNHGNTWQYKQVIGWKF